VYEHGQAIYTYRYSSGSIFDFKELGLLHTAPSSVGQRLQKHQVRATVLSEHVSVFQFTNESIRQIARRNDQLKNTWQTVFIGALTRLAMHHLPGNGVNDVNGVAATEDADYVDPLFDPLRPSEEPSPWLAGSGRALEKPLTHIRYYMRTCFSPPWPFSTHKVGLRHRLPIPTRDWKHSELAKNIPDFELETINSSFVSDDGNGSTGNDSLTMIKRVDDDLVFGGDGADDDAQQLLLGTNGDAETNSSSSQGYGAVIY